MKTTLTLIELADMINAHLRSGGLIMDAYRDEGQDSVSEACLEEWRGREDGMLCLRCPDTSTGRGTTILDSDTLEVRGHEVHYFSGTDYCGKVVFLSPAPVELPPRDVAAAAAAYAAAVSRCNRAVDAREVARDVAAEADADAKAARAAHEAADAAAYAAYQDMVAARAAFHATTV